MKLKVSGNIPTVAHEGDAGMDLRYSGESPLVVHPGKTVIVPTGTSIELEPGYAGLVLCRSGLAFREDITIVNSPGLIDSGYRGEIQVALHKLYTTYGSNRGVIVTPGDRIAQLVIVPVAEVELEGVEELSPSARGTAGYGSTGSSDADLAAATEKEESE